MKKIDIPYYPQEKDSVDCGPTCIRMVLKYYGIDRSLEELKKKLNYVSTGTSAFDNGSLLVNEGLKVTTITAQPLLFPPDIAENLKTQEDLIVHLDTYKGYVNNENNSFVLKSLKYYLSLGGKLNIEIPSFEHLKLAIGNDQLVMASLYAKALGSEEGSFHFVVVSGYDENSVFLNNPWPPSKHQDWFPVDRFLYGVHTSTTSDLDNGTFLVISK